MMKYRVDECELIALTFNRIRFIRVRLQTARYDTEEEIASLCFRLKMCWWLSES
jgi:hypothetical protein